MDLYIFRSVEYFQQYDSMILASKEFLSLCLSENNSFWFIRCNVGLYHREFLKIAKREFQLRDITVDEFFFCKETNKMELLRAYRVAPEPEVFFRFQLILSVQPYIKL